MTFAEKFESPVLSMEGKTAADLADRLTQILILHGLVPKGTKVTEVCDKLHAAFYAYHSDQGSENTGGWQAARADGDGGAFGMLFVFDGPSGERVRRALYTVGNVYNPYGLLRNFWTDLRKVNHSETTVELTILLPVV